MRISDWSSDVFSSDLLLTMGVTGITPAGVSTQEAANLGKELTPVGSQRAGNKDGTSPEWTGKASFAPAMLTITRDQLESLRKRLVKDIGDIVTNPDAVSEVLLLGQDVMDSDPAKFQQVMKLVRGMLTGDGKLKSDIDAVLATRGGKSVDGLLAQVEQKKIRLPALKDDIAAVLTALKKRPDAFSRMVAAFDIGKALDLAALVDSSTKGHSSADLMLAYMSSYVKDRKSTRLNFSH